MLKPIQLPSSKRLHNYVKSCKITVFSWYFFHINGHFQWREVSQITGYGSYGKACADPSLLNSWDVVHTWRSEMAALGILFQ
jgi:hypothetical protein